MTHLRSPILDLQNAIAGCAFRIAPERETELAELRDLMNLTLALVDEDGFSIPAQFTPKG